MGPFLIAILLIFALTALISTAILRYQFQNWPPLKWKNGLRIHISKLKRRRGLLSSENDAAVERQWATEFFSQQLRNVPLGRLDAFPGIGSVTIARLSQAGFCNLQSLQSKP